MAKLSSVRRIIPEDFKKEDQDVANIIASSYNDFADELFLTVNGKLDFDNLARSKVIVDIVFDANGTPVGQVNVATGLTSVAIINIGKVQNLTNSAARLTAAPYLDWSFQGQGLLRILYGRGFTAGTRYRVTLEIVQ
jgi:hypothetical protein